jgi:predicted MFS family arabinose efflux permease
MWIDVRAYLISLWQSNKNFDRRIWVITVISIINAAGFSISLPFLSLYLYQTRGFDMTSVGVVILVSGLASAASQVFSGLLSDRLGRRPLLLGTTLVSSFLYGGMAILISINASIWSIVVLFVAARSVLTMGRPVIQAMVTDISSRENLTETYGLLRVGQNLGWAAGPAVGGYLLTLVSYAWLFWFAALAGVAVFVLILITLKESFRGAEEPVTLRSIYTTTRDRNFMIFAVICMLVFMVSGQMISTLSVYLVDKVGFSTAQYGLVLTLNGIIVILLQYPIARLVSHRVIGSLVLGSLLYGIGYLAMGWVDAFQWGMLSMAIITAGEITYTPTAQAVVGKLAPQDWRGRYMGLFALSETLGYSFGPLLGGIVLDSLSGNRPLMWAVIASLAFVAMFLFYFWCRVTGVKGSKCDV